MAEDVKVSNWPSSGKEKVALDLMRIVMNAENKAEHDPSRRPDRDYLLTLYKQCYAAAGGVPRNL